MSASTCECFRKQVIDEGASFKFGLHKCPVVQISKSEHEKLRPFVNLIVIVSVSDIALSWIKYRFNWSTFENIN